MRNLFIIDTPLHLLNSLTLMVDRYADDDNCVLLTMSDYKRWIPVLNSAKANCNIVYILQANKEVNRLRKLQRLIVIAINSKRLPIKIKSFLSGIEDIERIVLFSPSILSLLCRSVFPKSTYILVEEGSGTYNGEIFKIKYNFGRFCLFPDQRVGPIYWFAHYICGNRYNELPDLLLVHDSDWVNFNPGCEIQEFNQTDIGSYYQCLHRSGDVDYRDFDVIVLGEPSQELNSNELDLAEARVLSDTDFRAIYRPHPRQLSRVTAFDIIDSNPRDWELRSALEVRDEHILMGVGSTAMMTPKLLYGKQPFLIFTYFLLDGIGPRFIKTMDGIVDELKGKYSDETRIMVPLSERELARCLANLKVCRKVGGFHE